ncbi:hypothetical protein [Flavobacterium sp.]|jgi:hypothetical protein|uniref:hypothetical protein n=1 Tax=Flavobacterium sp. TaxID=239 RepID=UPI002A81AB7C|nr:hypothetical protein [Flavobacterium sp.]
MKNQFLVFSICLLFYSCKKENENYIENIEVVRIYEGPSPDRIIFDLNVSSEVYSKMNEDSLSRQILELDNSESINYTNLFFGLEKLKKNKVRFHFVTPYFLTGKNKRRHLSDTLLIEDLNKSKDLKLILHFNKNVFEFKNK